MRKMVVTMTVIVRPDDTERSVALFFEGNPQYAVTAVSATEVQPDQPTSPADPDATLS